MAQKRKWFRKLAATWSEKLRKVPALRKIARHKEAPLSDINGLRSMMLNILALHGVKYRANFIGKEWVPCRDEINKRLFSYIFSVPQESVKELLDKVSSANRQAIVEWFRSNGSKDPEADTKEFLQKSIQRRNEIQTKGINELREEIKKLVSKKAQGKISAAEERELFLLTNIHDALGHIFIQGVYLDLIE